MNKNIPQVTAVFLTYKNRQLMYTKLIEKLFCMKVSNIIIVDNNAGAESKKTLNDFKKKYPKKIHIITNQSNAGSACGFAQGMQHALRIKAEYIWLLDDDLLPQDDALCELIKIWEKIDDVDKRKKVILLSNRIDKKIYLYASQQKKPHIVIGEKNQFRSFHIFFLLNKILQKCIDYIHENLTKSNFLGTMPLYAPVNAGYYGGMFFHRDLVRTLGFPDEKYFVYMDDIEYSYRNVLRGGRIYFVPGSVLVDQEQSWNAKSNEFAFIQIAKMKNYSALYYSIRNRVYFELEYNVDNYIMYLFNAVIYSTIIMCFALVFLKFKNIAVYCQAVIDGMKKRMGFNPDYPL